MELIWSFPPVILGVAVGTALALGGIGPIKGNSILIPALIIGVIYIPYLGKPIRGEVLRLREQDFVDAARVQGMGPWRIMFSEILPNAASTIIVFIPMMLAYAILLEAYLSFLGAGVQPPNASWGTLISDGIQYIQTVPTYALIPGAMLVLTVLSINVRRRRRFATRSIRARRCGSRPDVARSSSAGGLSAIALLFATSVVVFGIFEIIPSYNPARAIAGRNATQTTVNQVSREVRLRPAVLGPVRQHDEADLHRSGDRLPGRPQRRRPVQQKFPVTLSLVIPAGIIWLLGAILLGSISALRVGRLTDRVVMVAAILGVSIPIFLLAALLLYLFAYKLPWFPNTGYHNSVQPGPVGVPPGAAVDLDRRAVDRLLLASAAVEPARHGQPGLRAHGEGQGLCRSARCSRATCCATR